MCIGIPGQIRTIDGVMAKVEVCGIQREVDLTLVGAVDEQGQRWILATAQERRIVVVAPAEQVVARVLQPAAGLFAGRRRRGAQCLHLLPVQAGGLPGPGPGGQCMACAAEVVEQVAQWPGTAAGQHQCQQRPGFICALAGGVGKGWHARMLARKRRRRPRAPSCCCVGLRRVAYWASGCLSSYPTRAGLVPSITSA